MATKRASQKSAPTAPAMPNGVEETDWPFTYIVPDSKHEYVPKHHAERKIREALRAADNRDAAGVDDATFAEWLATEMPAGTVIGNPEWWANRIARQYRVRNTPAAVPAGEAVAPVDHGLNQRSDAWMAVAQSLNWHARWWQEGDGTGCEKAVAAIKKMAKVYAAAQETPAPVQAAPQEGEVKAVKIGYIDPRNLWLIQESRHAGLWQNCIKGEGAQGEKDVPLYAYAAHPSACELVVDEAMVKRAREAIRDFWEKYDGNCDGGEWDRATMAGLTAALQHRGDSQEVGRG